MKISEVTDLMTSGALRIESYKPNGELTGVYDTTVSGWGDIPFDISEREVTGISVIDDQLVLEYYDNGKDE